MVKKVVYYTGVAVFVVTSIIQLILHILGWLGITGGVVALLFGNTDRGKDMLIGGIAFIALKYVVGAIRVGFTALTMKLLPKDWSPDEESAPAKDPESDEESEPEEESRPDEEFDLKPAKTADDALWDLALISIGLVSPYSVRLKTAGVELLSPQHFAICVQATAYAGARVWARMEHVLQKPESQNNICRFMIHVQRALAMCMKRKGMAEADLAAYDADEQETIEALSDYRPFGSDPPFLLITFRANVASLPDISGGSAKSIAEGLELTYDSWAQANSSVFVASTIGRQAGSSLDS